MLAAMLEISADGLLPIGDLLYALGGLAAIALAAIAIDRPLTLTKNTVKEETEATPTTMTRTKDEEPVLFPENSSMFNPIGLIPTVYPGTSNGIILTWMLNKQCIFEWDENPNYSNGPHYHIRSTYRRFILNQVHPFQNRMLLYF
jgi:hypothetical protein